MIARLLTAFAITCLLSAGASAQGTVRQVYLIQNSGWMEPFYLDPASKFTDLVKAFVDASELAGVPVTVATFNQDGQLADRPSPRVLYTGAYDKAGIEAAVDRIGMPRRANGKYTDADFSGALQAALTRLLGGSEGIIWMFTNNKNSPNNSQEVVANTRAFYQTLRTSPFIPEIVSLPIRMPVTGPSFHENGFIIYGIAYGDTAKRALDVIVAKGNPVSRLFTDPPVQLKPLAPESVELRLAMQSVGETATASIQEGVLVVDNLPGDQQNALTLTGTLTNVAYPKKIASARLRTIWQSRDGGTVDMTVSPDTITDLAYGATSQPVAFTVSLPPVARPAGLGGYLKTESIVDGTLYIVLNDLDFALDDTFVEKISALSAGDLLGEGQEKVVDEKLPDIFFDFRQIRQSTNTVPIRMIVHHSLLPLYAAAGGGVLAIAALGFGLALAMRPRTQTVEVGGLSQKLTLKPGQSASINGLDGQTYVVTGRRFRPHSIT